METQIVVFTSDEASAIRRALQEYITWQRQHNLDAQIAYAAYMKIGGYHAGLLEKDLDFLGIKAP